MSNVVPSDLGYAMPPEWAPHESTWLSWPHNPDSWPGVLHHVPPIIAQAVAALAEGETVRINVTDATEESEVRTLVEALGALPRVIFHRFPTNDAWCRDHGAIFVTRNTPEAPLAALDFGYNAWGGKYPPFDLDNAIPKQMAEALGVPRYDGGMILEGGSVEVNGAGALLTTTSCLLNENRNPHLSQEQIEARLRETLGVQQILWLEDGIVGDDTDGHIDDITRFVSEDTVVTAVEPNRDDENHAPLAENLKRLRSMTLADGRPLKILELPMPGPLFLDDQRLPASYANYYIGNKVVLMPAFNDPNDAVAARILGRCFPSRRIVKLDCRHVVAGLGAFHCLTQQVPAVPAR